MATVPQFPTGTLSRSALNTFVTETTTNITNANIAASAGIEISKLATTGTLNQAVLFPGSPYMVQKSTTVTQAQNTTTTYFTISNIANEDSGWITLYVGGNLPADRVFTGAAWGWYKTGGTMNISAGSSTFISINVTSPGVVGSVIASSGDILVKVVTGAAVGTFKGNLYCQAGSLSTGMTIT